MADGNYLAEMLQAGRPGPPKPNVMTGMGQGLGLAQDIAAIPTENALLNLQKQKANREMAINNAISEYGKTGDIKGLQALDPQRAKMLDEANTYFKTKPPESIRDIASAMDELQKIAPTLNEESWPGHRKDIMARHPNLGPTDLPPETATRQQLFQFANYGALTKAAITRLGLAPKAVAPGGSLYDPQTGTFTQAPTKPMSDYEKAHLGVMMGKNSLSAWKASRTGSAFFKHPDGTIQFHTPDQPPPANSEYMGKSGGKAGAGDTEETTEVRDDEGKLIKTTTKRKSGGGQAKPTAQYSPEQLQGAYQQKAQEIAAMPDGPGKRSAMQQLNDWKSKHLGE